MGGDLTQLRGKLRRATVAALIAPTAACLLVLTVFSFVMSEGDPMAAIRIGLPSAALATMIATPVTLIIGLPLHSYLYQHGHTGFWLYLVLGGLAGLIAGSILFAIFKTLLLLVLALTIGFISSSLAWLIRRPDRDAPHVRSPDTPQA